MMLATFFHIHVVQCCWYASSRTINIQTLLGIMKSLEQKVENEQQQDDAGPSILLTDADAPATSKRKPRRPKEKASKIIFVFDDLSGELQTPSLTQLMKKNRWFRSKVIISSQYMLDCLHCT
jgi:hypothetical protein